jgi:hypothetical protein
MRLQALAAALLVLGGCSFLRQIGFSENEPDAAAVTAAPTPDEPAHVVVQHVLLSFEGSQVPGCTRTRDEAARLAQRVLDEAREGRDFTELVRLYSDDRAKAGTYPIANWGVSAGPDEVDRRTMVRGFGNLAFRLAPGEVGLVEYDENASPFGWHVMKRLK